MIGNSFIENKIRRFTELFGIDRFSKPALYDLDNKLEQYLDKTNGYFIEVGANDGFIQSNTYYLERFKAWTGILIEPIPERYRQCVKERTNSSVYNCALVSNDYPENTVSMIYSDLMSVVDQSNPSGFRAEDHALNGILAQDQVDSNYTFEILARTLEDILHDEKPLKIDFLSIDVEGYELEALKGLDLNEHRPTFILVEVRQDKEIYRFMENNGYVMVDFLSYHDVLFRDGANSFSIDA